jgi:hypothetical protein
VIPPLEITRRASNKLNHGVTSYIGVVQAPGCSRTAGAASSLVGVQAVCDEFAGSVVAAGQQAVCRSGGISLFGLQRLD